LADGVSDYEPNNEEAHMVLVMNQSSVSEQKNRVTYEIDSQHANASFKVRHLMLSSVRGELGAVSGRVVLDLEDIRKSDVFAIIDATGIDTRNPDRDRHLKSVDFLDVERFPIITFQSKRIEGSLAVGLAIVGDLTIRGVTQEVTLDAEVSREIRDPWNNLKRGVTARATIKRRDFGVSWNAAMDGGGIVVGEVVSVMIELELQRRED
jgi:polyisoprenoid-binding protein YceI